MEVTKATSLLLATLWASVYSQGISMNMNMMTSDVQSTPIAIHHVYVTSSKPNFTTVSMCFSSIEPVKPSWTVDEGFTPFYFNSKTFQSRERHMNGSVTATIDLPTDLVFNVLRCHLVCEEHSFLVHLALKIDHGMAPAFEHLSQYTIYVPPSSEIGISPMGEARFHAMVNTSGTRFSFGMLQAEVALYDSQLNDATKTYYDSNAAYSFLPDDKANIVRMKKVIGTNNEFHTDIIIKTNRLFQDGAVISVLSACTNPSSLIHRMDVKQVRYVHPTGTSSPVKPDTLGFIKEDYNLFVERNQHALIRCTVIGNPHPTITLHKKGKDGVLSAAIDAPYHLTELKYKSTAVFHVFNVDESKVGKYVCLANNGNREVESSLHTINLITKQMIQESV